MISKLVTDDGVPTFWPEYLDSDGGSVATV
jgi:hypothetical protein